MVGLDGVGAGRHGPTVDEHAGFSESRVAACPALARPIVVCVARPVNTHLQRIGLSQATRLRLRALLVKAEPPSQ